MFQLHTQSWKKSWNLSFDQSESVITESVIADPVISESVVADPVISDPVISKSVITESVIADPVVKSAEMSTDDIAQSTKKPMTIGSFYGRKPKCTHDVDLASRSRPSRETAATRPTRQSRIPSRFCE